MKKQLLKDARVSQRIDSQLNADLKMAAEKLKLKRSEIIRQALRSYLEIQGCASPISSKEVEVDSSTRQ